MVDKLKPEKEFADLTKEELKDQYKAWYAELDEVGGKTSPEGREVWQQIINWAGAVAYNKDTMDALIEVDKERKEEAAVTIQAGERGRVGRKEAKSAREAADHESAVALAKEEVAKQVASDEIIARSEAETEVKKSMPKKVLEAAGAIGRGLKKMLGGSAGQSASTTKKKDTTIER